MSGLGMDAYTLHLLGMAVEACAERDQTWIKLVPPSPRFEDGWVITLYRPPRNFPVANHSGPSLADALASLLRDLGVEVPERPTAERRDEVWQHLNEAEHNGEFLGRDARLPRPPRRPRAAGGVVLTHSWQTSGLQEAVCAVCGDRRGRGDAVSESKCPGYCRRCGGFGFHMVDKTGHTVLCAHCERWGNVATEVLHAHRTGGAA